MLSKALALASIVATSFALPDVTIEPLPQSCASYPGYNSDSQTAGPWSVELSDAEDPAVDEFGPLALYDVGQGANGPEIQNPYVTFNTRIDLARNALQCISNGLKIYTTTSLDASGGDGAYTWTPLVLSTDIHNASMRYLVDGISPTVYEHYIDGVKQQGWYLGGYNTTTWGVTLKPARETTRGWGYYFARLLPDGEETGEGEVKTFVKFQA